MAAAVEGCYGVRAMTMPMQKLDTVGPADTGDARRHPVLRRPRRDSQRRSRAILDAARDTFLSLGYGGTSMDEIAVRAGVSKRTVYSHWVSKENLFFATLQDLCSDILPAEMAEASSGGERIEDRLVRAGTAFLVNIYSDEQIRLFREVISESRLAPEVGRMMAEGPIRGSRIVMQRILAEADRRGELRIPDPDRAARQFLALLKTDIHMSLLLGYDVETTQAAMRALAVSCVDLFLNGCRA